MANTIIGPHKATLGEILYKDIERNEYLNELFNKLLIKYTRKLFKRDIDPFTDKEVTDLLRFADILSKSNHPYNNGIHKIWSQQIVALLDKIMPNNNNIKVFKHLILSNCNNYQGLKKDNISVENGSFLSGLVSTMDKEYLKIPDEEGSYFFTEQKNIFDKFDNQFFSYSAPTSMGKSFIMRIFIKEQIKKGNRCNFAIIVPTKALINETKSKILNDLKDLMKPANYKIVTSSGDLVLEGDHNFVFVMTPERFLYLLDTKPITTKYLFIDEAHKISSYDTRSAFYYELITKLLSLAEKPHIIFASPNIPNPDEYLKLIPGNQNKQSKQAKFSPVSQIKYVINTRDGSVHVFNDYSNKLNKIGNTTQNLTLNNLIDKIDKKGEKNIVYCSSLDQTIKYANSYANNKPLLNDPILNKLSADIEREVNSDYYLVDLIKRGIAYHVGYLPSSIRIRIENSFKSGLINTIFCTSTLIEGVNLPADNLYITSYKNGPKNLDAVCFRNLIGRVGRIDHNLFGNVFMVYLGTGENNEIDKYNKLLTEQVPPQKLSIETAIKDTKKTQFIDSILNSDFEFSNVKKENNDEFDFMRKFSMILIDNVVKDEDSLITKTLLPTTSNSTIAKDIKEKYENLPKATGINITYDQFKNLKAYIASGAEYPKQNSNGRFDFDELVQFLVTLNKIFKWQVYEKKDIGPLTDKYGNDISYAKMTYFGTLLNEWMTGNGLSTMIYLAIKNKENNPKATVKIGFNEIVPYEKNNKLHKNAVISEVLKNIDKVILFTFANYFREFSTEYKKFHNVENFDNDWYEYVEYGTTNELTIKLQRNGYTRESALYIQKYSSKFINLDELIINDKLKLNASELQQCTNESVKIETKDVMINVPELFE